MAVNQLMDQANAAAFNALSGSQQHEMFIGAETQLLVLLTQKNLKWKNQE
jgi:hypothetical protein